VWKGGRGGWPFRNNSEGYFPVVYVTVFIVRGLRGLVHWMVLVGPMYMCWVGLVIAGGGKASVIYRSNVKSCSLCSIASSSFTMANQCVICQDVLGSGEDSLLQSLRCGHVYHDVCLSAYQQAKDVPIDKLPCPYCKLSSEDCARLEIERAGGGISAGNAQSQPVLVATGDTPPEVIAGDETPLASPVLTDEVGEDSDGDDGGDGVDVVQPKAKAKAKAKSKSKAAGIAPMSADGVDGVDVVQPKAKAKAKSKSKAAGIAPMSADGVDGVDVVQPKAKAKAQSHHNAKAKAQSHHKAAGIAPMSATDDGDEANVAQPKTKAKAKAKGEGKSKATAKGKSKAAAMAPVSADGDDGESDVAQPKSKAKAKAKAKAIAMSPPTADAVQPKAKAKAKAAPKASGAASSSSGAAVGAVASDATVCSISAKSQ
jgi:hypothetical protein